MDIRKVNDISEISKPSAEVVSAVFDEVSGKIKAIDSNGNDIEFNSNPPGSPLIYKALITQTGTNDPTVDNVIINTLGGVPVWTRPFAAGVYNVTLNGAFPDANKISFSLGVSDRDGLMSMVNIDANSQQLLVIDTSGVGADDSLNKATILIEVYP